MRNCIYPLAAIIVLLMGVSCEKTTPEPVDPEVSVQVSGIANTISFIASAQEITFNVKVNYDWTISSDADWLTLNVNGGAADAITSVTATVAENEEKTVRTANITISVEGKEGGKVIPVQQAAYDGPDKDSHALGHVFYSEDFNWIKDSWNDAWAKYGWSTATPVGYSKNNECSIGAAGSEDLVAAFKSKGIDVDSLEKATYAKYEGFVKLGKVSQVGFVTTPMLSGIDAQSIATLDVSWNASLYMAPNGTFSANQYQWVTIEGEGRITSAGTIGAEISEDMKSVKVPLDKDDAHKWCWTKKHIIVSGADAQTRIMFGKPEGLDARSFIDDINITRAADKDAVAAQDAIQALPPLSYEVGTANKTLYAAAGESGYINVHVNRGWTVTSDSEWLKITGIACGTENYANTVAEDGLSGEACASGLLYAVNFVTAEYKESNNRTATIKVFVDGNQIGSATVTQAGYVAPTFQATPVAKWSWTSLYVGSSTASTAAAAEAWINGNHTYASDVVEGGIFSCSIANSAAKYSVGTSSQKKDRLRVNKLSKDDYFQFVADNITAEVGDSLEFSGVSIGVTNASTSPNKWEALYSLDGATWTKYAEYTIEAAANMPSLACKVPVTAKMTNGQFYVRVVCVSEDCDTRTNIAMIVLTADSNVASINDYYTDNWAYAVINVLSPAK